MILGAHQNFRDRYHVAEDVPANRRAESKLWLAVWVMSPEARFATADPEAVAGASVSQLIGLAKSPRHHFEL